MLVVDGESVDEAK